MYSDFKELLQNTVNTIRPSCSCTMMLSCCYDVDMSMLLLLLSSPGQLDQQELKACHMHSDVNLQAVTQQNSPTWCRYSLRFLPYLK